MTFNLRCGKSDAGNNAWRVQPEVVATIVSQNAPDVVGSQEGKV